MTKIKKKVFFFTMIELQLNLNNANIIKKFIKFESISRDILF